jgi:hypothetical protein
MASSLVFSKVRVAMRQQTKDVQLRFLPRARHMPVRHYSSRVRARYDVLCTAA